MKERMADSTSGSFGIGTLHEVPCVRLLDEDWCGVWGVRHWWPVIGPRHHDAEYLNFKAEHYHVDQRFVSKSQLARMHRRASTNGGKMTPSQGALGVVLSVTRSYLLEDGGSEIAHETSVRPKVVRRDAPTFPTVGFRDRLRSGYAGHALKDGLACPHKGAALGPHADAEGIAICPLHGLCWNIFERRLATDAEEREARNRLAYVEPEDRR